MIFGLDMIMYLSNCMLDTDLYYLFSHPPISLLFFPSLPIVSLTPTFCNVLFKSFPPLYCAAPLVFDNRGCAAVDWFHGSGFVPRTFDFFVFITCRLAFITWPGISPEWNTWGEVFWGKGRRVENERGYKKKMKRDNNNTTLIHTRRVKLTSSIVSSSS